MRTWGYGFLLCLVTLVGFPAQAVDLKLELNDGGFCCAKGNVAPMSQKDCKQLSGEHHGERAQAEQRCSAAE
ncbi:MAG TPA: hypothetical protein DDY14_06910 [Chromatiaceae bacterium]|jgi:hypothetical protein|nr:MAG: hypothetical protein N838_29030 [Thiohalocapsa sp. PB-PSB1]HBG95045.1 hypothetical protein [Chromatiaceae bacterium]HCS92641.1 hypothetical protein [Chromatiaceae bacterium]